MADFFPINKMISKLNVAPLQPAYFRVDISAPRVLAGLNLIQSDTISMMCENAILPGIGLQATTVRQAGIGNIQRRPTDVDFSPFTASFICDGNGEVVRFFQNWMQHIYRFNTDGGIDKFNTDSGLLPTYTFEYPDEYEATITVTQYSNGADVIAPNTLSASPILNNLPRGENRAPPWRDPDKPAQPWVDPDKRGAAPVAPSNIGSSPYTNVQEKPIVEYKIVRAFPYNIGSLDVSWATQNDYHLLQVQFYYESWQTNLINQGSRYTPTSYSKAKGLDVFENGSFRTRFDEVQQGIERAINNPQEEILRRRLNVAEATDAGRSTSSLFAPPGKTGR